MAPAPLLVHRAVGGCWGIVSLYDRCHLISLANWWICRLRDQYCSCMKESMLRALLPVHRARTLLAYIFAHPHHHILLFPNQAISPWNFNRKKLCECRESWSTDSLSVRNDWQIHMYDRWTLISMNSTLCYEANSDRYICMIAGNWSQWIVPYVMRPIGQMTVEEGTPWHMRLFHNRHHSCLLSRSRKKNTTARIL